MELGGLGAEILPHRIGALVTHTHTYNKIYINAKEYHIFISNLYSMSGMPYTL